MSWEGENYSDADDTSVVEVGADLPKDRPRAALWRVVVMPVRPRKMSKGGIALPSQAQDAQAHLNYVGRVASVGPGAWKDPRFEGMGPFPKEGDYIVYGRYAGQPMTYRGVKFITINDDEWLVTVDDPEALTIYV